MRGSAVDLVEENRSRMSSFEAACAIPDGSRESTPYVAKEFAFEQAFAQSTAIDFDERTAVAIAEVVNRVGNDLFARSRLTQQENGRIAHCNSSGDAKNLLHCRARTDHAGQLDAAVVPIISFVFQPETGHVSLTCGGRQKTRVGVRTLDPR